MYYSCHCIKRNGLQHDCRRTGCGGESACLHMPDPLCAPSQLARARGLADPGPLAAHMRNQGGGGGGAGSSTQHDGGSGKRFIVCELKGITPDISADKSGKCCKCPAPVSVPSSSGGNVGACILANCPTSKPIAASGAQDHRYPCKCDPISSSDTQGMYIFDEKTINKILSSFDKKDLAKSNDDVVIGPGGRSRKIQNPTVKEPCTRPGCVHWKPPPPCCWDAPCKADCFETPPGIQPGRNPLTGGGRYIASGGPRLDASHGFQQPKERMKLLSPYCCTGCSAPDGNAVVAGGGGPVPGLPVLVMKLC